MIMIASCNNGTTFWTSILVVMSNEQIIMKIGVKRFS